MLVPTTFGMALLSVHSRDSYSCEQAGQCVDGLSITRLVDYGTWSVVLGICIGDEWISRSGECSYVG